MKLAKRPLWLFLTALLVFLIVGVNEGSHAFAKTAAMENEFQQAAKRYQVPVALLKAVSYNESRWDSHSGKPSVAGGYGVMHLTDVTGLTTSGADSAAVKTPNAASLHTLQKAAKLTGLSVHQLKTNTAANIQGGAALLRFYQKSLGKSLTANLNSWYAAVAKYSQSDSKAAANYFAENVYQILKDGESQNGITIAPQKVVHLKDQSINSDSTASSTDGPSGLPIEWIPALYKEFDDQGDYGNYDLADRPNDMKINYIVIHNTETSFQEALDLFSTPTYTTANYVVSSVEGTVAEMVRPQTLLGMPEIGTLTRIQLALSMKAMRRLAASGIPRICTVRQQRWLNTLPINMIFHWTDSTSSATTTCRD